MKKLICQDKKESLQLFEEKTKNQLFTYILEDDCFIDPSFGFEDILLALDTFEIEPPANVVENILTFSAQMIGSSSEGDK